MAIENGNKAYSDPWAQRLDALRQIGTSILLVLILGVMIYVQNDNNKDLNNRIDTAALNRNKIAENQVKAIEARNGIAASQVAQLTESNAIEREVLATQKLILETLQNLKESTK